MGTQFMLKSEEQGERMLHALTDSMYTKEERERFHKIIESFNALYYKLDRQTWCWTTWKGINVYKFVTDLWIYQELIEKLQPDLIIETGTMRGGSAVYMDDVCKLMAPQCQVISIDIDISNRHALANESRVKFIDGSSVDDFTIKILKEYIEEEKKERVMVILDSDHTKEHVLKELDLYSKFVSLGMALIVEDTNVSGPKEAVDEWLMSNFDFKQDHWCEKFMLSANKGGYLEKVAQ